ncbi:hypothetical protein BH09PAT3_BH09PAT3_1520 [soil metagenome]
MFIPVTVHLSVLLTALVVHRYWHLVNKLSPLRATVVTLGVFAATFGSFTLVVTAYHNQWISAAVVRVILVLYVLLATVLVLASLRPKSEPAEPPRSSQLVPSTKAGDVLYKVASFKTTKTRQERRDFEDLVADAIIAIGMWLIRPFRKR